MNSMETLTEFLGWCTVISFGILLLASLFLTAMRGWAARTHASMFGLREEDILRSYVQYLAQYKIAFFVLSLVPFAALKMKA